MKTVRLGRSDLEVSRLCLGSMTWGTQNTQAEGHQQIDRALDLGVNFIDTAEMYPTNPVLAETVGGTEEIIGAWFEKTGRRQDVILATKVTGHKSAMLDGRPITAETVKAAAEGSLRRLKTDVIDLYQLHWPSRGSYHFRQAWTYDPSQQDTAETLANIHETLEAIQSLVREGKVRWFGLSNETAWGTAQFLRMAETEGLPRVVSMQNEYSLLCRWYDLDMAELSHHEDVGLLSYSSLAAGLLTGKYADGARPAGSRGAINGTLGGRITPFSEAATAEYVQVAQKHGLDPSQMALAWCLTRPFMASVIIGATKMAQMETDIAAEALTLSEEVMADIDTVRRKYPAPY